MAAELGAVLRASCRGSGELHLGDALAACDDLLLRHGGHAGAAGFEMEAANWEPFRARFLALAAEAPARTDPGLAIDLALAAADVDYGLHRDLVRLGPWGVGNPEPLVAVLGLTVTRAREAGGGGHAQLVLKRRLDVLDGIAFGWPELVSLVTPGDRIDVVARLASRRFGGIESLQLEIRDAAPSGSQADAEALLAGGRVAVGPGPATSGGPSPRPALGTAGEARTASSLSGIGSPEART